MIRHPPVKIISPEGTSQTSPFFIYQHFNNCTISSTLKGNSTNNPRGSEFTCDKGHKTVAAVLYQVIVEVGIEGRRPSGGQIKDPNSLDAILKFETFLDGICFQTHPI